MNISEIADWTGRVSQPGLNEKGGDEEKIKEAFKTIFVEQMIGQLMKTGNLVSGADGLQKELLEGQIKQSLSQYFIDGAGIRWNEILGLSPKGSAEAQQPVQEEG